MTRKALPNSITFGSVSLPLVHCVMVQCLQLLRQVRVCFWYQSLHPSFLFTWLVLVSSPTTHSAIYFFKSQLKYLSLLTPFFILFFPVLTTILSNHYILIFLWKLQESKLMHQFVTVAYVASAMVPGIVNE